MPALSWRVPTAFHVLLLLGLLALFHVVAALGEEPAGANDPSAPQRIRPSGYAPPVAAASDEGQRAIERFRPADGLSVSLYAAEPLLANPVAFCFDERGRCYVAETFRQERGVEDNRAHFFWLDDDLASETVADRLAMFQKHLGEKLAKYGKEHDRIRVLLDRDSDGQADVSHVFADGFNDVLDGTGAGVLARDGFVYYACIPHLWLLKDENDDHAADVRQSLHHGYGVHVAFRGHDLHGFAVGPDGKLYFSIGDRGFNVTVARRNVARPHTGAILRCNLDGSELEVFAEGLRNPQELAFDEYGNLFTCDNNSDSGDRARWVHVVEGGNSGWLMSYQYFGDRGPWNREKLWHPWHEGQAAYIVPPLANFADGPSGLAYDPGTGLPEKYRGAFLLCDFRGTPARSGVHAVWLKPKGASFELAKSERFLWGVLATDVEFGPGGAVYVSDWVDGWYGTGKGRIYRVRSHPPRDDDVDKLLAGISETPDEAALRQLLAHADRRVRLEAQLSLVRRGYAATLQELARKRGPLLPRLHAIWGLGMLRAGFDDLQALLADSEAEIRAQAARTLGDVRHVPAASALQARLRDESPRVRFHAAIALGKLGRRPGAVGDLLAMLNENADRDPFLRHAGVMGLTGVAEPAELAAAAKDAPTSARLGIVLALRRHQAAQELAAFLDDAEPLVAVEAARAIHDDLLHAAMPQLAALASRTRLPDSMVHRALNANFRLGTAQCAASVAALAADASASPAMRIEAMRMLADWSHPKPRDRILGLYRPLRAREGGLALQAVRPRLAGLFAGPAEVRQEAARLAGALKLGDAGPLLSTLATDVQASAESRADALAALVHLRDAALPAAIDSCLQDAQPAVRAAAHRALAETNPARAAGILRDILSQEPGTVLEKQSALAALATMCSPEADALLLGWLERLMRNEVPPAIQLDLLMAAAQRKSPSVAERLAAYEAARDPSDPLAAYRETLAGGDAKRGETIFFEQINVSCRRCHKVGTRGGDVGPELTTIAKEKNREYLLESLVLPDKSIAKGFESVVLLLDDGTTATGILKSEDDKQLQLQTPQGNFFTVEKSRIEQRERGKSAMPEDLTKHLSKRDIRDLVEYLAGLK